MQRNNSIAIFIVILAIVFIGGFYLYGFTGSSYSNIPYSPDSIKEEVKEESPARVMINFTEEGYIVSGNPGLEPGATFFVYEKPGAQVLTLKISLNPESNCVLGLEGLSCTALPSLSESFKGKRVRVSGYVDGSNLNISGIEEIVVVEEE